MQRHCSYLLRRGSEVVGKTGDRNRKSLVSGVALRRADLGSASRQTGTGVFFFVVLFCIFSLGFSLFNTQKRTKKVST